MSTALVPKAGTIPAISGKYDRDLEYGSKIRDAAESLQFMLGDWVNGMLTTYEESERTLAADMSRVTGVAGNTLREYAKVARAFAPAERSASLSFSHHLRAASGEKPSQVLKAAEASNLSVRDTARLAQGLPIGGESEAQAQSSTTVAGASMEEAALEAIAQAERYLTTALNTIRKPGFRCTVPVGQTIMARLEAASKPFVDIEDAVKAEVGAYL